MKLYESVSDISLTHRIPVILRFDGHSFSSWTSGLQRPFDDSFRNCMEYATYRLCREIEGARFAYTESDEISVFLVDYQTVLTQPWFNFRIQKRVSIGSSICTTSFITAAMKYLPEHIKEKGFPKFDARVFSLPKEEVSNYFLWRTQDCSRNSIQALARCHFSQKQLHNKSCEQIQEMLFQEHKINWNDTPTKYKQGVSFFKVEKEIDCSVSGVDIEPAISYRKKWIKDYEMPIITKNPQYINKWVEEEPSYITDWKDYPGLIDCVDLKPEF
jgi:tRNA(His) 5'-end guanylyltransferase